MAASPGIRWPYPRLLRASLVAQAMLVMMAFSGSNGYALSPMPHTTLIFFADRPLNDNQWTALVSELHRIQSESAAIIPALVGEFDVLRGGGVTPAAGAQKDISVFLHGDCTLMPGQKYFSTGTLGWVPLIEGRIQPFIHVRCDQIVEMLGPLALGMSGRRRDVVMAEAIARVILHEWIHIATQTTHHLEQGVMKSQFEIPDLLADDIDFRPRSKIHHEKKRQSGL